MIEKDFWLDVKAAWIVSASPQSGRGPAGAGDVGDPLSEEDPWEPEVSFDELDFDKSVDSMMSGGDFVLQKDPWGKTSKERPVEPAPEPLPVTPSRPALDVEKFEEWMDQRTLNGYVEAARLLADCQLPDKMEDLYQKLISRIPVLQDAVIKFKSVYQADLEAFYDYYIPEALQLTSAYLEYLGAGVGADIVSETEDEIMDVVKKLILAINDKIDEIYQFASIEIKAKAKALESLMSQDGYVDPEFKLN